MSKIIERVDALIKAKGISVRSFEKSIGTSNGAIANAIKKGTDIGSSSLSKIIETYPDVNASWLLTGSEGMIKQENIPSTADGKKKEIPLIPLEAFAGYSPVQYNDIPIEEFYNVVEFNESDFLIRIKGDSMAPKYHGGDIIACKLIHETLFFQWHRVHVIYTRSQGVMIKRVEESKQSGYIRLVSENKDYAPFEIPKSDISDIALVLGAITLE